MADTVTRDEFERLEGRVRVVEREVEGEKMVTRYILDQTRRNGDDLAVVLKRLDRLEGNQDRLEAKHDRLEAKVDDLAKSMPRIVADTMREVLKESKK